jgi:hypothetical protein
MKALSNSGNRPALPPLSVLLECSQQHLADLELLSLERAQSCIRCAQEQLVEAVEHREIAGVAGWLRDNRGELLTYARRVVAGEAQSETLTLTMARRFVEVV